VVAVEVGADPSSSPDVRVAESSAPSPLRSVTPDADTGGEVTRPGRRGGDRTCDEFFFVVDDHERSPWLRRSITSGRSMQIPAGAHGQSSSRVGRGRSHTGHDASVALRSFRFRSIGSKSLESLTDWFSADAATRRSVARQVQRPISNSAARSRIMNSSGPGSDQPPRQWRKPRGSCHAL